MSMVMLWCAVSSDEAASLASMDGDAMAAWLERQETGSSTLDLDKEWHALHAVLTGTAWDTDVPRGRAVLGGREVGDDLGYGPPRVLSASEVAEVADELEAVDPATLEAAIDTDRLAGLDVYPSGVPWGHPDERRYLMDSFDRLRAFYRRAAEAGQAVVIVLT